MKSYSSNLLLWAAAASLAASCGVVAPRAAGESKDVGDAGAANSGRSITAPQAPRPQDTGAAVDAAEASAGPRAVPAEHTAAGAVTSPRLSAPLGIRQDGRRSTAILTPAELAMLSSAEFKKRFVDSFVAMSDLTPPVDDDEREVVSQAVSLFSDNKLGQAARLLEDNRSGQSSAMLDFYLGNVHFQADDLADAIAAYDMAVQKHPRYQNAWSMLAELHYRQGNYDEAVRAFSSVLRLGGGDDVTYGLLGYCHAKNGNSIAAESAFRHALMLAPQTVEWKIGLADSFFQQQRFEEAAAFFGTLIDETPNKPELWIEQGRAFALMGQATQAAQNFEMADRLGGSSTMSLMGLGDIYANQDLFDLSVDAYGRALAREDADTDRILASARFITAKGAGEPAGRLVALLEEQRGAQFTDEQRKKVLKLRQRLAADSGATAESLATLQEIIQVDPMDGEALLLLGLHYARSEDPAQAVLYYERAANIEATEADAKLYHGELLAIAGKYEDAVRLLKQSYELEPRGFVQKFLDQVERAATRR